MISFARPPDSAHYSPMAHHDDEWLPTRASLLGRLKNWEDQISWQTFFDTYAKLIYGFARKSGLKDQEAQDVVQETMRGVAKHMPSFHYDPALGSFKGWLLQLTRWRINDQVKKRASARLAPEEGETVGTATSPIPLIDQLVDPASLDLDHVWEMEWEKNLLAAALTRVKQKLDPAKYQIFDFYVNKEWEAEKVSEKFNIPVAQVHLIKHRVTNMLREEIKRLEKEPI
jgi:RNA polymerase sigma factor (sigma-70 family)